MAKICTSLPQSQTTLDDARPDLLAFWLMLWKKVICYTVRRWDLVDFEQGEMKGAREARVLPHFQSDGSGTIRTP